MTQVEVFGSSLDSSVSSLKMVLFMLWQGCAERKDPKKNVLVPNLIHKMGAVLAVRPPKTEKIWTHVGSSC